MTLATTSRVGGEKPRSHVAARLGAALRVAWLPLLLLAVWALVTELGLVRPLFLPGPRDLWRSFVELSPVLPKALLISFSMIIAGFVLGSALGIALGMVISYPSLFSGSLGALFNIVRPVPIFALIPLFVLWFGIGPAPQIALISFGCLVIVGVATAEAIRNTPRIYIQAARTLGAPQRDVFLRVILPYIQPHLIGAIRVAAAAAFGLDVAAEFMGSQSGLGYLMIVQQQYLKTSGIIVIVAIYSVCALILDRIIAIIERKLTSWTERRA